MRLKDLVRINQNSLTEMTHEDYLFRYIDISGVDGDGNIILSELMVFGEAPSRARRIVNKGDVIISTVRTYLRAIGEIDFEALDVIASTGFAVCTPRRGMSSRYLMYALRCDSAIDEINVRSSGISYPAINITSLSAISVPYVNAEKQSAIVSFLDEMFSKVDERIKLLEKKVEAYKKLKRSVINEAVTRGLDKNAKLKDSGVDWIGMVPEVWEVTRFKTVCKQLCAGKRPADDPEEVLSIGGEHIQNGDFALDAPRYVSRATYNSSRGKIEIGDILVVKDGATIGKSMYVTSMPESEMLLNEHVYRVVASKFFYYWIVSTKGEKWFRVMNTSTAQESIPQEVMYSMPIVRPSSGDQQAIAAYLDEKCGKIDGAIANIEKQIDAYKRLKRSLINEVVTGKRKVA